MKQRDKLMKRVNLGRSVENNQDIIQTWKKSAAFSPILFRHNSKETKKVVVPIMEMFLIIPSKSRKNNIYRWYQNHKEIIKYLYLIIFSLYFIIFYNIEFYSFQTTEITNVKKWSIFFSHIVSPDVWFFSDGNPSLSVPQNDTQRSS